MFLISSVITPSTTYSGDAPPSIVPTPLMRTVGELLGSPEVIICTPATLPWIACVAVSTGCFAISAPFTLATEPVTSIFLWVPYPTTTTCSSCELEATRETLTVDLPATATSFEVKPTDEKTNVASEGAERVNAPEALVEVPLDPPFTVTLAPLRGVLLSPVTVPVIATCWAEMFWEAKRKKTIRRLRGIRNRLPFFIAIVKCLFIVII